MPRTEDGDLQSHTASFSWQPRGRGDVLKPESLTVYTTDFDEEPPAPVSSLAAERIQYSRVPSTPTRAQKLTWHPSASPDVIYYRVFYGSLRSGQKRKPRGGDGPARELDGSGLFRLVRTAV